MNFKLTSALCAACVACTVFAAETAATKGAELGKWTMDVPAAQALAKETGKPILMNFTGSDWCGWCKLMEKKVFAETEWQAYAAENLVLVMLDFPRNKELVPAEFAERNRAWADRYGVQGFPTYVLLATDGETELGRLSAESDITPADFIRSIKSVLVKDELDKRLSAEDYATWNALSEELKALEAKAAAWQEKMRKESAAFQASFKELQEKRNVLLEKAVDASEK